jgi:hypothetical protein
MAETQPPVGEAPRQDDSGLPKPLDLARFQKEGIPPVAWLAEPFLVEGEIHILVGDGSTCKTFLALDIALGLASGQPVFIDREVSRPYRILYLDEDGSERQLARRICALAKGRSIVLTEDIVERFTAYSGGRFALDGNEGYTRLKEVIARHRPDVLILDALRAFHGGDENDSRHMALVFRHTLRALARKYGLTILLIHHTSKGSEEAAQNRWGRRNASHASRGSTEIRNSVDTLLYVERSSDGPPSLTIDKTRSLEDADKPDPLTFTVSQESDGSVRIVRVDGMEGAQTPKLAKARAELEAALPTGSKEEITHSELMSRLPGLKDKAFGERTARSALKGMVPSVFRKREEGKNTLYSRADSG